MITKQIITREIHFNSSRECDIAMKDFEASGYKILEYGSEDNWYFICKKEK